MRDVDESLPVGKWAYGLMFAFLLCLGVVCFAVGVDWQSRHELERISEPTAVGGPIAAGFDAKLDQAKEVVRWRSTPYYPVQGGKIWLYREKPPPQENEIIIKIGANQFLRLAPK
jgi:hypothetical protein